MKIAFLFPESGPYEALDNWVRTIGRHAHKHEVELVRKIEKCRDCDCLFLLTEARTFPRKAIDQEIAFLSEIKVPFAVVHNNDAPCGVPTPGHYPSFCWTRKGQERLRADYQATLLRQPVLPPILPPYAGDKLLVGTFGHIEPKKQTFEMNRWARKYGVPFAAVGPKALAQEYVLYMTDLVSFGGCKVGLHDWFERVEELAPLVADFSHFLFVLTDAKRGSGGSPTSPRFAGLFNRPVIVVDDETTFREDRYYVYPSLADLKPDDLNHMALPFHGWSPDAYLDALTEQTLAYWR